MWSLGCTAIYLFNGTSYFLDRQASDDRRNTAEVSIEAATRCDLSRMETSPEWQGITGYQKDFVRKLLVLDERARMTAQQALEHRWFTQCQEVFEAAYDHATKYWQPHRIITDMIETIPSKSTIDHPTKVLRSPLPSSNRRQLIISHSYGCRRSQSRELKRRLNLTTNRSTSTLIRLYRQSDLELHYPPLQRSWKSGNKRQVHKLSQVEYLNYRAISQMWKNCLSLTCHHGKQRTMRGSPSSQLVPSRIHETQNGQVMELMLPGKALSMTCQQGSHHITKNSYLASPLVDYSSINPTRTTPLTNWRWTSTICP